MRFLSLFVVTVVAFGKAHAQMPCSAESIQGTWKMCGSTHAPTYNHPPAFINTDSLKKVLCMHSSCMGKTWRFNTDGTYYHDMVDTKKSEGRFWVVEKGCKLKVSFRRRNPMRIIYLDDSCMMLWYNNPKTAYIDVYQRCVSGSGIAP